jgi:hypothetical protein
MAFFLYSQFSIPYSLHEQRLVFSIYNSPFTSPMTVMRRTMQEMCPVNPDDQVRYDAKLPARF